MSSRELGSFFVGGTVVALSDYADQMYGRQPVDPERPKLDRPVKVSTGGPESEKEPPKPQNPREENKSR